MAVETREPAGTAGAARAGDATPPTETRRPLSIGFLLAVLWALVLGGAALLVLGGPSGLTGRWPWAASGTGVPPYRELVYPTPQAVPGRDLVIAPADATPERIEWLVLALANEDRSPTLRLNVFTDEAAARRRQELVAAGVFAKSDDENEPDPVAWTTVYPAWVGIYTRDPQAGRHQLSICLNDPTHERCTVRRYS